MIGTRAAELARMKVTYPLWRLSRDDGEPPSYRAVKDGTLIQARSLVELAGLLDRADEDSGRRRRGPTS
jgi:hypothetical protein